MKTATAKSDTEIKTDVLAELKYEPSVKSTDIGVLVHEGVVTLNGFVTSYNEKWNALRAVKRINGVSAIADEIAVKLGSSSQHSDSDIAQAAAHHMKWCQAVVQKAVKITVHNGWITLEGEVEWMFQKTSAESTLKYLAGVIGVTNSITIKPVLQADDIENDINNSMERNSFFDAEHVNVETDGSKVILTGTVRNYYERDEAVRIAWAARGVYSVDNQIEIDWNW